MAMPQYYATAHADARRRGAAGGQVLRRPSDQGRRQRACIPTATAAPTAGRRLRFWTFTIRPRAALHAEAATMSRAEAALDFLTELSTKVAANQGEGLAFPDGTQHFALARAAAEAHRAEIPQGPWFMSTSRLTLDIHRRAATQAFGAAGKAVFNYDTGQGHCLAGLRFHRRARKTRTTTSAVSPRAGRSRSRRIR